VLGVPDELGALGVLGVPEEVVVLGELGELGVLGVDRGAPLALEVEVEVALGEEGLAPLPALLAPPWQPQRAATKPATK
jgi:hypothetical protein